MKYLCYRIYIRQKQQTTKGRTVYGKPRAVFGAAEIELKMARSFDWPSNTSSGVEKIWIVKKDNE